MGPRRGSFESVVAGVTCGHAVSGEESWPS